jgi:hypothetical protein
MLLLTFSRCVRLHHDLFDGVAQIESIPLDAEIRRPVSRIRRESTVFGFR